MSKNFTIIVASVPDRDNLVTEIYYNNVQWAEISKEDNKTLIQFYSYPDQDYWEFPLEEALQVLESARDRFLKLDIPFNP